jgi:hypothetical protein
MAQLFFDENIAEEPISEGLRSLPPALPPPTAIVSREAKVGHLDAGEQRAREM